MSGKIESGGPVTVAPADPSTITEGDIVLCKARGTEYLHLVKGIKGDQFLIGNNKGRINGWISKHQVFGKCVSIEQ